jgi:hypothetical protein
MFCLKLSIVERVCNHIVWFAGGPRNPQGINFEALRPLIKSEQASVSEPDACVLCTHASP